MLNIRPANPKDIVNLQRCNQLCLPENYVAQFWVHCIVSWPNTSFLAEDASGRVVGYVLASVEPVDDHPHLLVGHINSLAVIRPYRRLGLAKRLMDISKESMTSTHYIQYIQLNVRISNRAALALYRDVLGYTIYRVEHKYCEHVPLSSVKLRRYRKLGCESPFNRPPLCRDDNGDTVLPRTDADGEDAFCMRLWIHGDPSTPHTRQEKQTVLRAMFQYASHKGRLLLACVRRSPSPR
ncbi:hypothetical protein PISMIDRAFT_689126 [Pisolithus microcarpus 441]|uniref:N-acetyltransferase domain-containing protein n=1 Tax=Pisolithus microcarpus 441 TaxID=765257 RepID=A0A0C9XKM8_9AGAM|nr:hypothetical protein PISMIDRAFT_689126 [Pisolithus microcarpus 441]